MFDRKHYFYHDMPNGYQITQEKHPIASDGSIEINFCDSHARVPQTRTCLILTKQIHVENDTAKQFLLDNNEIGVDLLRHNVPLIEIVTQPCFSTINEALYFVKWIKKVCQGHGMYREHIESKSRFDINISVSDKLSGVSSDRIEVKNQSKYGNAWRASEHIIKQQRCELMSRIRGISSLAQICTEKQYSVFWKNNRISMRREKIPRSHYCFLRENNLPIFCTSDVPAKTSILERFVDKPAFRACLDLTDPSEQLDLGKLEFHHNIYGQSLFDCYDQLFVQHKMSIQIFVKYLELFHNNEVLCARDSNCHTLAEYFLKICKLQNLVNNFSIEQSSIMKLVRTGQIFKKNSDQLVEQLCETENSFETDEENALACIREALSKCKVMKSYFETSDIRNLVKRYQFLHMAHARNRKKIASPHLYKLFTKVIEEVEMK